MLYPHSMAKLDAPWDKTRIMGMKGKLDFYYWKGIPVVRKWPYTPPSHISPRTRLAQVKFSAVSHQYSQQGKVAIDAEAAMADQSQTTPRDYYVALNYSGRITFELAP